MGVQTDSTGRLVETIEPTPERMAKPDIVTIESERGGKETRSYGNNPLDFYLVKNALHGVGCDPEAARDTAVKRYAAGVWYAELFCKSGRGGLSYTQFRYTDVGGGDPGVTREDAERAYKRASGSIRVPGWRHVVTSVCCYGEFAADLRRREGFSRREPMKFLRHGLDDLVKHFGY